MAAGKQTVLQFFPSSTSLSARVHPVVLFNICDCYVRRPDQADRVIGTLLGSVSPDGTVEIKNSYAVPHNESADQVALDIDYHHNMFMSHQKVNPKEVIVGWYSTGFGVSGGSTLIHEFYSREVSNPVHLTVDTGFLNGEASIKAYVSVSLSLGDRQLAAQFQEIPLDMRMIEAERVGSGKPAVGWNKGFALVAHHSKLHNQSERTPSVDTPPLWQALLLQKVALARNVVNAFRIIDILKMTMVDKLPNDLEGMEASMERLLSLIDDVYKYVDDVVEGRVTPDDNIGRFIADTLSSVPKLSPAAFDKLFNDRIQDNLALVYLSSLTRTQLSVAEKLNTAAQIL